MSYQTWYEPVGAPGAYTSMLTIPVTAVALVTFDVIVIEPPSATLVGTSAEVDVKLGDGAAVGTGVGVGAAVGTGVGTGVGTTVGTGVGTAVGTGVGAAVGAGVATGVGAAVATGVGAAVGAGDGVGAAAATVNVPPSVIP